MVTTSLTLSPFLTLSRTVRSARAATALRRSRPSRSRVFIGDFPIALPGTQAQVRRGAGHEIGDIADAVARRQGGLRGIAQMKDRPNGLAGRQGVEEGRIGGPTGHLGG